MNSPCSKCIVVVMCQEPCWMLSDYIDEKVSKACKIKHIRCDSHFLEAIGIKIRREKSFVHKITARKKYFTMIVTNTNIVVKPHREKGDEL